MGMIPGISCAGGVSAQRFPGDRVVFREKLRRVCGCAVVGEGQRDANILACPRCGGMGRMIARIMDVGHYPTAISLGLSAVHGTQSRTIEVIRSTHHARVTTHARPAGHPPAQHAPTHNAQPHNDTVCRSHERSNRLGATDGGPAGAMPAGVVGPAHRPPPRDGTQVKECHHGCTDLV